MAKKKNGEEEDIVEVVPIRAPVETAVAPLDATEFGREDLNKLASKINEIIKFIEK